MHKKSILLVDFDDLRRETRAALLERAGMQVTAHTNKEMSDSLLGEGEFDLLLLAVHDSDLVQVTAYAERVRKINPSLPILLLTDAGVFVPDVAPSEVVMAGDPVDLVVSVSRLLARNSHVAETSASAMPPTSNYSKFWRRHEAQ